MLNNQTFYAAGAMVHPCMFELFPNLGIEYRKPKLYADAPDISGERSPLYREYSQIRDYRLQFGSTPLRPDYEKKTLAEALVCRWSP